MSQPFSPDLPPPPPPKPNSQDASRQGTPRVATPSAAGQSQLPPTPELPRAYNRTSAADQSNAQFQGPPDPGPQWLPKILEDKSKQDLAAILADPSLITALTHAQSSAHPSTPSSQQPLQAALAQNIDLATHLITLESRLEALRSQTQTQLLATHALERLWREKQSEMDRALSPFSPSSLYQRLGQGVQEQEQVCRALEASFLEGDGDVAGKEEVEQWVKRYRDAKKLYYGRSERKQRWDEGRVGGWR